MQEILDSIPDARAMMIREIAARYGEKRVLGEPFQNPRQVFEHFKRLKHAQQEEFHVLILDNKHRIIHEQMISKGTLNQSITHPREIFAPAISLRAAAIILIHNHPSGVTKPSQQDIEITKRLCKVGEITGISVVDHVIVGDDFFSFMDEGMI